MVSEKNKGYRHLPAFLLMTLAHGPGHGGALLQRLPELLPMANLDTGALYRTLNALEAAGEIAGEWDTTGRGPAKKTYQLTEAGWARLAFWREDIRYRVHLLTAFLEDSNRLLAQRKEGEACPKP